MAELDAKEKCFKKLEFAMESVKFGLKRLMEICKKLYLPGIN